ncbi:MAG: HIT domain-containing protein [Mycoplasmataceae bacterium]|nr:HIT domain-containing protein [Mycoplasmataceae bacterium]
MNNNNCIFCKIASGEIDSHIINSNDKYISFLDINPSSNGHALIVPRKHSENIFEMNDYEGLKKFIDDTKLILDKLVKPDGYYIRTNSGSSSGQIIFHTHLHLVPTYEKETPIKDPSILIKELK